MFDDARWPLWAQALAAMLSLLVVVTVYWLAWFRPGLNAAANSTPVGWRSVLAALAVVAVLLVLGWNWVATH